MPKWTDAWREAPVPKRIATVAGTALAGATFALDAFGVRPVSDWVSRGDHGRAYAGDVHNLGDWALVVLAMVVGSCLYWAQRRFNARAASQGRRMRDRQRQAR